jgi:hypothetical protein
MKNAFLTAAAGLLFAGSLFSGPITLSTNLSGSAEDPPNASPGTGTAIVTFDDEAHTLRVQVDFSGLLGLTTVTHIHCCTAVPLAGNVGVATAVPTFPGFPAGVSAGTYDETFDTTLAATFNPAFVTSISFH